MKATARAVRTAGDSVLFVESYERSIMSEAKHTPGPWEYMPHGLKNGTFKVHDGDTLLATTNNNKANARLIAAAPDLLEALRAAKQVLETASRYFPKSIKNSDRFSLLNVLANSVGPAIAKATE